MRLIDANGLFDKVGKIKPRSKEHYKSIEEFMNLITDSPTIDAVEVVNCVKCEHYAERETPTGIKGVYKIDTARRAFDEYNNGKWIPVSEKLPKDPRPVLVTILWHEPYDNYEVSIEEYWDNGDGWGDWLGAEIVAWMPLPKPYKGGEDK